MPADNLDKIVHREIEIIDDKVEKALEIYNKLKEEGKTKKEMLNLLKELEELINKEESIN